MLADCCLFPYKSNLTRWPLRQPENKLNLTLISKTSHNQTDSHDILCRADEHRGTHGVTQGPKGAVANKSVWLWGLMLFIHLSRNDTFSALQAAHAHLTLGHLKETLLPAVVALLRCDSTLCQMNVSRLMHWARFPSADWTAATCPISLLPNVGWCLWHESSTLLRELLFPIGNMNQKRGIQPDVYIQ